MRRVARPYAEVLLDAAREAGLEESVALEIGAFATEIEANVELRALAENPTIASSDKERVFGAVAATRGASDLAMKFLRVLVRNDRLREIRPILAAYQDLLDRARGVAHAEIRTATPLDPARRARLEAALVRAVGRKVRSSVVVDTALGSGFVAKVGSMVFDGSLRGEIEKMHALLAGKGALGLRSVTGAPE